MTRTLFAGGRVFDGTGASPAARFLVTESDGERWVFPVAEVDQVRRLSRAALAAAPPTVAELALSTRAKWRLVRA